MRRLIVVLLVIGSLGCTASLEDVRKQKPVFTGDFPQPYRTMTTCVFDRFNSQTGSTPYAKNSLSGGLSHFLYRIDEQPDQRLARIDAMSVGGPPSAEFEITVEPAASGTSHVEYRRRWGGFWGADSAAWSVVMACGQPQA